MDESEAFNQMVEEKRSHTSSPNSTTKAIYCEILTKHPSTKVQSPDCESRMKFVTQSSLLRAVQKARFDVDSMLRQSVCGSGMSTYNTQLTAPHSLKYERIPPLSWINTREAVSVSSNSSIKKNLMLCSKGVKSNNESKQVYEPNPTSNERNIMIDCSSKTEAEKPQLSIQNQQPLTNEDLKWLGKNYVNQGGQPTFKITNPPHQHINKECSPPERKCPDQKNRIKVHAVANELVNRVQLREQQLWKQLAEMSISSHSTSEASNALEENYELLLTNQPVLTVADETPKVAKEQCQSDTYVVPATQDNEHSIIDTDNILDFLDDEWFDNLLKAELEII